MIYSLENERKVGVSGPTDFQNKLHQQLILHEMHLQYYVSYSFLILKILFSGVITHLGIHMEKIRPLLCKKQTLNLYLSQYVSSTCRTYLHFSLRQTEIGFLFLSCLAPEEIANKTLENGVSPFEAAAAPHEKYCRFQLAFL